MRLLYFIYAAAFLIISISITVSTNVLDGGRHESGHLQDFIAAVLRREEVLECLATTGDADYHLRVICEDLNAYNRFLEEFLFQIPGVANVKTNLVLKEIKGQAYVAV